jgi:hypothetical protein
MSAFAIRRIIRTKRRMHRAADILEREAAALKESHTVNGMWGSDKCDKDARAEYDEMMEIAKDLRAAAGDGES